MRRPEKAEAGVPPVAQLRRLEDGVRALHGDDESEGRRGTGLLAGVPGVPRPPFRHVRVELRRVADEADVALALQGVIVGQLSLRDPVRLGRRGKVDVRFRMPRRPRDHRGETQGNSSPAHLRKGDRALRASLAGSRLLSRPDRVGRTEEVAVPLQRVQ
jgi:hypothetical protein